jgi:hypothetical protein
MFKVEVENVEVKGIRIPVHGPRLRSIPPDFSVHVPNKIPKEMLYRFESA